LLYHLQERSRYSTHTDPSSTSDLLRANNFLFSTLDFMAIEQRLWYEIPVTSYLIQIWRSRARQNFSIRKTAFKRQHLLLRLIKPHSYYSHGIRDFVDHCPPCFGCCCQSHHVKRSPVKLPISRRINVAVGVGIPLTKCKRL
jgi:hypothetical protein